MQQMNDKTNGDVPAVPVNVASLRYGGVIVVVFVVALSVAATGLAVWWRHEQGRRAMEFWGKDAAIRIRHAPQVEVLQLAGVEEPSASAIESLTINGRQWAVVERRDISNLHGLVHARHALIEDASFEWDAMTDDSAPPTWDYALRFTMDGQTSIVAIDFDTRFVVLIDSGKSARLSKQICEGWRKYTEGQFASAVARPSR